MQGDADAEFVLHIDARDGRGYSMQGVEGLMEGWRGGTNWDGVGHSCGINPIEL